MQLPERGEGLFRKDEERVEFPKQPTSRTNALNG